MVSSLYVAASLAGTRKRFLIPAVIAALVAYGLSIAARRNESWRDFGLRLDNLRDAALPTAGVTLLAALPLVAASIVRGTSPWRPEFMILLPLYPLYGIAQQVAFQGILHRRLQVLLPSPRLAVFATAIAFGAIHLGHLPLTGLTFAAGLVWSALFARHPNTLTLGISHGILATLTYPLLLETNPLDGF